MHIRDARGAKPFGRRRTRAGGGDGDPAVAADDRLRADRPAGTLDWALRISAIAGLCAIAAVSQLARLSQTSQSPASVALDARHGRADPAADPAADPETTGAIKAAGAAAVTRLDPCHGPAADRLRP